MPDKSLTDVPEQSHEAMRAAAMRPVSGPAATPAQAAGGGLELPGGTPRPAHSPVLGFDHTGPHEPIPGEHDATTLTHREAGAMGGAFNGEETPPSENGGLMDEQTIREHVREGGGLDAERHLDKRSNR